MMADSPEQKAVVFDPSNVTDSLFLSFHDIPWGLNHPHLSPPVMIDARVILDFYKRVNKRFIEGGAEHFLAQCEAGVGRSQAVIAALMTIEGRNADEIFQVGTYNRKLYRLILDAAGIPWKKDPKVSIVVRLKYPLDRFDAFLNCMRRQRWDNLEIIAVNDGPCSMNLWDRHEESEGFSVKIIETPEPKGHWGHPYRQLGIDAATGDWIGLTNDDNYYVPGFVEQMVGAAERNNAEVVMCQVLHSYAGWGVTGVGTDLGCFLAKRELVKETPWEGIDLKADRRYLQRLLNRSRNIAVVERPLFIHN